MQNIKLTIAYDGSDFHGWQFQPNLPTIQGALEDALQKIIQERVSIHGASRTDAGVHALGQVAHFKTHSNLAANEILNGMNAMLPPSIRIVVAEEVSQTFHSRWQAQAKTYKYRIARGPVLLPFDYRHVFFYPWPLDETAMDAAAAEFTGEHDFTTFAASTGSEEDDQERDMLRVIHSSEFRREIGRNEIEYIVRGKSFLRYMVRKMVGTLMEVGRGKLAPGDIPKLFDAKDRSRSGPTVVPEGLYLMNIEYPDPTDSLANSPQRQRPKP
ncbi:MAG TPA: tRNA pseudouridine(38-40) synthase TruA [Candidatus Acidoferrales bacterium]